MASKFLRTNLKDMIETLGEDRVKSILANFSCEVNKDVEYFLRQKAVEFAKQGLSETQLVYYKDDSGENEALKLVGYYTLAQKTITISKNALSNSLRKRIHKFATYDFEAKKYTLPVILIGQLGKNYADGNNQYITGDELIELAFNSVETVQRIIGGKAIYLESEEKEYLLDFYQSKSFVQFGKRQLDGDETNLDGKYLIQWIKYMGR